MSAAVSLPNSDGRLGTQQPANEPCELWLTVLFDSIVIDEGMRSDALCELLDAAYVSEQQPMVEDLIRMVRDYELREFADQG